MAKETKIADIENNKGLLLTLLSEIGAQKRQRSESQHIYSAAALGSFGAVTWGVAALQPTNFKDRVLTHPALIAALGVLLVALVVIAKIRNDNETWGKIKADEARVAKLLSELPGADEMIPEDMMRKERGPGSRQPENVVKVAAAVAFLFCISLLFSN